MWEIRNEARVHLWYEHHFGVPCPPYPSTEATIDSLRRDHLLPRCAPRTRRSLAHLRPHGLSDVFNLVVRPNPVLAPRHVYETKTHRWVQHWPELTVLPWPDTSR